MNVDPPPMAPASYRVPGHPSTFSAGAALSTSFSVFWVQAIFLVPLAALFLALPFMFELSARKKYWDEPADPVVSAGPERATSDDELLTSLGPWRGEDWLEFAAGSILPLLFQALVAWSVFQRLRGVPARPAAALRRTLLRLPVVLLSGIAIAFAMGVPIFLTGFVALSTGSLGGAMIMLIGLLALVVHLATCWYVAVQVCVVEDVGPIKALGRSTWLTYGAKLKIFGILLLIYGVPAVIQAVVESQLFDDTLRRASPGAQAPTTDLWIGFGLESVVQALAAVTAAVVYRDLRRVREGTDLDQQLAVFD